MDSTQLRHAATKWADGDPDEATAAEVRALVAAGDEAALEERFGTSLEFGTAGLRGVLGGGTNRMNRAVVRRTTAGLARYLKAQVPEVTTRGVVLGRDGRRQSDVFIADAAGVLAAEGIPVWVFEGTVPTPLVAYGVKVLGAAAGVMVTASHNPPEYNGYKVYWGNGAQIIPPHDAGIARAIDAVGPAREVPVLSRQAAGARWKTPSVELQERYFADILALRPTRTSGPLRIVYTAMHGVGGPWTLEALRRAGFEAVHPVPEQLEPDGNFPTVRFPNPEEKGAMDLSRALAERVKADVVLANDPDADRLAVMARDGAGALRMLTGNEVGVILGHFLLSRLGPEVQQALVISTIVSSGQLGAIAKELGARYAETLTGFKWIANRALELEAAEPLRFVMGYEEALGYTVGTVTRDKDGVGTALVMADLAAWCHREGLTLLTYLERVQRAHGLFVASQFNATLPGATGAATIAAVMEAFRTGPPSEVGEWKVSASNDYQTRQRLVGNTKSALELPRSNVLAYELEGGARVTLRPSGTEPKLKVYFEVKELVGDGPMTAASTRATARLAALETAFLRLARARGLP